MDKSNAGRKDLAILSKERSFAEAGRLGAAPVNLDERDAGTLAKLAIASLATRGTGHCRQASGFAFGSPFT